MQSKVSKIGGWIALCLGETVMGFFGVIGAIAGIIASVVVFMAFFVLSADLLAATGLFQSLSPEAAVPIALILAAFAALFLTIVAEFAAIVALIIAAMLVIAAGSGIARLYWLATGQKSRTDDTSPKDS